MAILACWQSSAPAWRMACSSCAESSWLSVFQLKWLCYLVNLSWLLCSGWHENSEMLALCGGNRPLKMRLETFGGAEMRSGSAAQAKERNIRKLTWPMALQEYILSASISAKPEMARSGVSGGASRLCGAAGMCSVKSAVFLF